MTLETAQFFTENKPKQVFSKIKLKAAYFKHKKKETLFFLT